LGILERGQMIETDRQGLVAGYVGQTAIKTSEKIEEAIGGVLFIDEAYALSSYGGAGRGDFGDEAIQTLLKKMEDQRGDFFVFVAGYTDNMETFLKANPGLNSRFDKMLKFEDYNAEEMLMISKQMLTEFGLIYTEAAETHMRNYLAYIYNFRDKYFGNARTVRNIVTEMIKRQNLRLANLTTTKRKKVDANEIEFVDVEVFKLDKTDFIFNKRTIGFGK
jgi:SpoVK/Ycf46/Vps4 family AAA+-type ATPase